MGINAFSMEIYLAKCLTHDITATMRDRAMVSEKHQQEPAYWKSNGQVTDDIT